MDREAVEFYGQDEPTEATRLRNIESDIANIRDAITTKEKQMDSIKAIAENLNKSSVKAVAENLNNLQVAVNLIEWLQERGSIAQDVDPISLAFEFALDDEELEPETVAAFNALAGEMKNWPEKRKSVTKETEPGTKQ